MAEEKEDNKIGIDIKKDMNSSEILEEFKKAGFQAGNLNKVYKIWKNMLKDDKCIKIMTAAGALIPAGLRKVFVKAINNKLIDILILTSATLTHDLIEAFGFKHESGSEKVNDEELADKNIDRIYNIFLKDEAYQGFEKRIQEILKKMPQKKYSPQEFLKELANHIEDENSIIKSAAKNNVKIFCPGFTDSILGFQTWMYSQENDLEINSQLDIRDFLDIIWKNKEKDSNQKYGIIILGGGVPKNFALIMMQVSNKEINHAIQITMDRPEQGGLSGATLSEAKSWKKISKKAETAEVISDITIILPLLVSSLIEN